MLLGQEPGYQRPDERLDRKFFVTVLGVLSGGLSFLLAMMFLIFPDWVSPRTFRTWFRVPAARAVSVFASTGTEGMAGLPVVLRGVTLDQGELQMSGQVADPLSYDAIANPPSEEPVEVTLSIAGIPVLPAPPTPQWEAGSPAVSEPREPVVAEPASPPAGIAPNEPVSEPVPTASCSTDPALCSSAPAGPRPNPGPPPTSNAPPNAGPPPNPGPPVNVVPAADCSVDSPPCASAPSAEKAKKEKKK